MRTEVRSRERLSSTLTCQNRQQLLTVICCAMQLIKLPPLRHWSPLMKLKKPVVELEFTRVWTLRGYVERPSKAPASSNSPLRPKPSARTQTPHSALPKRRLSHSQASAPPLKRLRHTQKVLNIQVLHLICCKTESNRHRMTISESGEIIGVVSTCKRFLEGRLLPLIALAPFVQ